MSLAHVHGQHTFRTLAWSRGLFSVEVTGFKTGSRILKYVLQLSREGSRLLRLGLVKPGLLSQAHAFRRGVLDLHGLSHENSFLYSKHYTSHYITATIPAR